MRKRLAVLAAVLSVIAVTAGIAGAADVDFGLFVQSKLADQSRKNFGFNGPLDASSTRSISQAEAQADPTKLATVAHSLQVRVVSAGVAPPVLDMAALWPNTEDPEWLIQCNEEGTGDPGVVRINIATGESTTIVTGTTSCDPVRATPWGTIIFAEEAGGGPNGGRVYELINPLETTGVTLDRATGTFSGGTGAANLTVRPALGRLSFEGFAQYSSGVTYFGDENRPSNGVAGGAFFKFVPASLRDPSADPITSLSQSPYAAGSIFGLRVGGTDNGQGNELGQGHWIPIPAAPDPDLRAQAAALHLTGYYRPEDLDIDRGAEANGNVRFCGNNTGNDGELLWGETTCILDGTLAQANANTSVPEVQRFVPGSPELTMPDNIAYQPGRGNWIIHEDANTTPPQGPKNDDLWSCLPDGADPDLQSDGCVRFATLNDTNAEWTGGIFDASGQHFYVSVQHNVTGAGTILDITGWK
jgi:secreted PhoX family phosphatase